MSLRSLAGIVAIMLLASPAIAQVPAQPQLPQTPREQALGGKLIQEINENLTLATNVIVLQQQVQKLQEDLAKARQDKKSEPAKQP